jgi:dihydrofolate synthase/folylpolyglutamate synthase
MLSYGETLDYLYSRLPVFQHIGKAAYKADLNNTLALCAALGNPEKAFKSIHVGGTNGKGSVSSMLSAIFTRHGLKTGLYTSPHLKDFRERIRINGEMISEAFVVNFTEKVKPLIESIEPSFFEITVAMAFEYFRAEKVDIAIVEVGMGGRLDSTNVITPELAVVTNIGWDHMDFLGDTLPKIATEKAGIIKPEIPVVIGESSPETRPVFLYKAESHHSPIYFAEAAPDDWIEACELKGNYQRKNLATVKKATEVLKTLGYALENEDILKALKSITLLTGLRGRWEVLQTQPLTIADTAHNSDGLRETMSQLRKLKAPKIHFVLGVVNDKDLSKMLPLLPVDADYYFCKPNIFRGLNAEKLAEQARNAGLRGKVFESVEKAKNMAKSLAGEDDVIYIGGSTFVVAEAL